MASQVTVVGPAARRYVIKTTPGTYLNDVLQEACTKFNLEASQYGFKHNSRPVDLSRTVRLAGLPPGARLELVQQSRSPLPVNVALELPESELKGLPNGPRRLTEKFSSTTSLWQVLRFFESSGQGPPRDFTQRGKPRLNNGTAGAGKVVYEMPVINVMGREFATLTDLTKNLGQLGLSGSAVLRLAFRDTDIELHEAIEQTKDFFGSTQPSTEAQKKPSTAENVINPDAVPATGETPPEPGPTRTHQSSSDTPPANVLGADSATKAESSAAETTVEHPLSILPVEINDRPITVFAAPSSSTPQAALARYNAADYVPSMAHAQAHQSRLQSESRNKRLLTDAQEAAQAAEQAEKLATIKRVDIKLKFPDETSAVATFVDEDAAQDLYDYVEKLLDDSKQGQPFTLFYVAAKGQKEVPKGSAEKLIRNLGFTSRVMVTFKWDDGADMTARSGNVLKGSILSQAQQLRIEEPKCNESETENVVPIKTEKENNTKREKGKPGMPKWLKGLSKK